MNFFITNDCSIKDEIIAIEKPAIQFLENIVKQIDSVKKIIITDCDFDNYQNSVRENSIEIDTCISLTKNSGAVVIHGLNSCGILEQYIYIRGDIFHSFCACLCGQEFFERIRENFGDEQASLFNKCANSALKFVLHEIGHAIDYENLLQIYGYLAPAKKQYYLPNELKEYAEYEMMTIWSEYFAERCVFSLFANADAPPEDEVNELLTDTRSEGIVEDASKIFRLLYWFAQYIAYFHQKDKDYSLLIENNNKEIISLLSELSNTFKRLYDELGNWNFDLEFAKLGELFVSIYKAKCHEMTI